MTTLKNLTLFALVLFNYEAVGQSTVKLEGTHYRITLPHSYKIQKKTGIDYKTFYIKDRAKKDSSKTFIMFGCCVGTIGENQKNANKIDSVKQILLGKEIEWKIYMWDSDYLAETKVFISDSQKVVFGIKTKNRNEVNLLISAFGTLQKRR